MNRPDNVSPAAACASVRLGGQRVLEYRSVLHDDHEILVRLGDKRDVVNGITVDHQQIGKRAIFYDSQLA
jgi:hypothetical protein